MTFIFDTTLFSAFLRGDLLATDEQFRAMRASPNENLRSRFRLGLSAFITDGAPGGDGQDVDWVSAQGKSESIRLNKTGLFEIGESRVFE